MMAGWLLIDDDPASGARNMAVDEFLLKRAENKGGAPVLRLYSFRPPAITIGYHQDAKKALDLEAAAAEGIDVVRRITGGRALLHDGELTYSVTSPIGPPFGHGLADTFLVIAGVIVSALRSSGIDACVGSARHGDQESPMTSPCLVSTSRHEITAGGKKISGSAQRRTGGAFIQHGSILMRGGSERIGRYLRGGWKGLAGMITTVEAETGKSGLDRQLRDNIIAGFGDRMGAEPQRLSFVASDLAAIEIAEADKGAEFFTGKAEP
jgi:lipoate-protein ligase A